ncbi:TetR family transcriptional regulator [Sphingomonas sp. AP4-R1]|uniref:TetR family transcriptional regulator n=1 Tax=Sphingomonas sp. AP4-R1 TaxID=2735134 RepID=UPI001493B307|nr:TetR family transcriptional regulator [Sphingomonas sp. AP4-R1]QJU59866.1 TetR family transcriptional regulator [Sphingomonas sp. AP4-R1]
MLGQGSEGRKESEGSAQKLIEAVLTQWEYRGSSAISARSLTTEAGVPVSSLYHHFGNLEHLYLSAQAHARLEAERWCAKHLDSLAVAGWLPPSAFPALLAVLIDDWTERQRRLAFAWRECALAAAREPSFMAEMEAWRALWSSFWQTVCDRCGRSRFGELTAFFFYNESLFHLIRWHRAIDCAALHDLCAGWSRWLEGELAEEGPWRRAAREEAARTMPSLPVQGELSGRIAEAAATILLREGLSALTHRAVAAEAGLTLGVVSHNVRTSADLVRAAFEMVYRRVSGSDTLTPQPLDVSDDELIGLLLGFQRDEKPLPSLDELLLAVARDPSLASFIPQLRYMRGRTSGVLLPAIAGGGRTGSPLDHALLSAVASGMRQACLGTSEDEARRRVEQTVATLIGMLRRNA